MPKTFKLESLGLQVEIGKYARQADGAAWIRWGDNIVLATAVASKEEKDFMGFFPLTVEYRERPSAAGKIPGGFIKREGKLSDGEVLQSRLIDRPVRPLFPKFYFNEVQIIANVLSSDGKFPTGVLALLGSSIALMISDIPFLGPVGAVQMGRVNGEWKFNLSYEELTASDADMVVAGTRAGICMVEGHCNNVDENELIELFFKAHEIIKQQCDWQIQIQQELGIVKAAPKSNVDWEVWDKKVRDAFPPNFEEAFFASTKVERATLMDKFRHELIEKFKQNIEAGEISKSVLYYLFDGHVKTDIPDVIARRKVRFDGRKFDAVRPITCETSVLPCAHGSSVFTRGETQALATLTLGTAQDAQKVETLFGGLQGRSFMLHYNFPPFSTGDVKPLRGVGRREIGHGYLAETSFYNVLPSQEDFPYTVRSVVDVLESNGSSSMATVCSTTLAMLDAGVPIKSMIGGVAMGLVRDSQGELHILTDILGSEDEFGLMDFKVTGTDTGVMALQMDIKDKVGFPKELFVRALAQAKAGRLHILGEMRKLMAVPRPDISPFAPRVSFLRVPQDKIGAIIGPAGKVIKEIVTKTGAQIDIEDDGTIRIYAKNNEIAQEATNWIKTIAGDIEVGSEFNGIVRRYADFGIFVEIVPGKDGLIHVSSIAKEQQKDLDQRLKINDTIKVRVVAYDPESGRIRLVAPELER